MFCLLLYFVLCGYASSVSDFCYDQIFNITNPTGSNFQGEDVMITLDTSSLVENDKVNGFCSDLRLKLYPDGDWLDFWFENKCGTENTRIWINLDIPAYSSVFVEILYYVETKTLYDMNRDNSTGLNLRNSRFVADDYTPYTGGFIHLSTESCLSDTSNVLYSENSFSMPDKYTDRLLMLRPGNIFDDDEITFGLLGEQGFGFFHDHSFDIADPSSLSLTANNSYSIMSAVFAGSTDYGISSTHTHQLFPNIGDESALEVCESFEIDGNYVDHYPTVVKVGFCFSPWNEIFENKLYLVSDESNNVMNMDGVSKSALEGHFLLATKDEYEVTEEQQPHTHSFSFLSSTSSGSNPKVATGDKSYLSFSEHYHSVKCQTISEMEDISPPYFNISMLKTTQNFEILNDSRIEDWIFLATQLPPMGFELAPFPQDDLTTLENSFKEGGLLYYPRVTQTPSYSVAVDKNADFATVDPTRNGYHSHEYVCSSMEDSSVDSMGSDTSSLDYNFQLRGHSHLFDGSSSFSDSFSTEMNLCHAADCDLSDVNVTRIGYPSVMPWFLKRKMNRVVVAAVGTERQLKSTCPLRNETKDESSFPLGIVIGAGSGGVAVVAIIFCCCLCFFILIVIIVSIIILMISRKRMKGDYDDLVMRERIRTEEERAMVDREKEKIEREMEEVQKQNEEEEKKKLELEEKLGTLEKKHKELKGDQQHVRSLSRINKMNMEVIEFEDVPIDDGKKLGKGRLGFTIYKSSWKGKTVLFRVFKEDTFEGKKFNILTLFEMELSEYSSLDHPNVLKYFAYSKPPSVGVVTEYAENATLPIFVKRSGDISFDKKVVIVSEIVEGMLYLHKKGIVHKDLRGGNIFITKDVKPKIDFGFNRTFIKNLETSPYAAPELVMNESPKKDTSLAPEEQFDKKCDVFSFGILLYELASDNYKPYGADHKEKIGLKVAKDPNLRPSLEKDAKTLPNWFKNLAVMCWDADPNKRPSFKKIKGIISAVSDQDDEEDDESTDESSDHSSDDSD